MFLPDKLVLAPAWVKLLVKVYPYLIQDGLEKMEKKEREKDEEVLEACPAGS